MKKILLILFIFVSISGFSQIEKAFQNIRVDSVKALDGERLTIGKIGDTTNVVGVLYNNGSPLTGGVWTEVGTTAIYTGDVSATDYNFTTNSSFDKYSYLQGDYFSKEHSINDGGGIVKLGLNIISDSLYVIKSGEYIYYRSRLSDYISVVLQARELPTGNFNYNFQNEYLISPSTANTISNYTSGTLIHQSGDDDTPINTTNINYIGANHGILLPIVISTGHDKDAADIGSFWNDGTNEYQIFYIGNDTIKFRPVPYYSLTTWIYDVTIAGDLTHVAGATHTTTITRTSTTSETQKGYYKDHTIQYLVNGEYAITGDFEGYVNYFDVIEQYTIPDPRSVPIATPMDWTNGDDWLIVKNTYRYQDYGAITVYASIYAADSVNINYAGFIQSAKLTIGAYDDILSYVPKTSSFVQDSRTWDFSNIDTLTTSPSTTLYIDADKSTSITNVPDRYITFLKSDASDQPDVGFAMGYNLNYAKSDTTERAKLSDSFITIINSGKTYPHAIESGTDIIDSTISFVAYRQYFDPRANDSLTAVYYHSEGNYYYIYIAAHRVIESEAITLPDYYTGLSISVVENKNMTLYTYSIPSTGIVISSESTEGYMVLKCSGTTKSAGGSSGSTSYWELSGTDIQRTNAGDVILGTATATNVELTGTTSSYLYNDDNNYVWSNGQATDYAATLNTIIGYQALTQSTGHNSSVGIGYQAGYSATGNNGTFIGTYAGKSYSTGADNTMIGYSTGYTGTNTGARNVFIGSSTGKGGGTGGLCEQNTLIGSSAGFAITTAENNSSIGFKSLYALTTGDKNTAIGAYAGYTQTTASSNVFLGYMTGYYETGSNTIMIDNVANTTQVNEAGARARSPFYAVTNSTLASQIVTLNAGTITANGDLVLSTKTPASAGATGTAGTIAWDADYIYICTATNTWKRVAISTW